MHTPTKIAPGVHEVAAGTKTRRYLARDGQLRFLRTNGRPGSEVAARLTRHGVQLNPQAASAHRQAARDIAAGRARLIQAQCAKCHRELTDAESIKRQLGPDCAAEEAAAQVATRRPAQPQRPAEPVTRPQPRPVVGVPTRCDFPGCTKMTGRYVEQNDEVRPCCQQCALVADITGWTEIREEVPA